MGGAPKNGGGLAYVPTKYCKMLVTMCQILLLYLDVPTDLFYYSPFDILKQS